MVKLQKPRPAPVEKKANPTWIGTKLDAMREKMYKKDQKTSPPESSSTRGGLRRKVPNLAQVGTFLQRKGRGPKFEEQASTAAGESEPIITAAPAAIDDEVITNTETLEYSQVGLPTNTEDTESPDSISPTSACPSDSTVPKSSSKTSRSSDEKNDTQPTANGLASEGIQVRDFGGNMLAHKNTVPPPVSMASNALGKNANQGTKQLDTHSEEFLDGHYDNALRLQAITKLSKTKAESPRLFTQAELKMKIEVAVEENDDYWMDQRQREKNNSPYSVTPRQVDELISAAVEKQEAKWRLLLETQKQQYESKLEGLNLKIKMNEHTEVAIKSREAQLSKELQLKDGLIIASSQVWQARFDGRRNELVEAQDRIEELERYIEDTHQEYLKETAKAERCQELLTSCCESADSMCLQFANVKSKADQELSDLQFEQEKLSEKYLDMTQRHATLESEYSQSIAGLENENQELREALDSALSSHCQNANGQGSVSREARKMSPFSYSTRQASNSPDRNMDYGPWNAPSPTPFTFSQPDSTPQGDYPESASQNAFASKQQMPFQTLHGESSNKGPFFDGLPSPSSNPFPQQPNSSQDPVVTQFSDSAGPSAQRKSKGKDKSAKKSRFQSMWDDQAKEKGGSSPFEEDDDAIR